jgi:hypothetical protein
MRVSCVDGPREEPPAWVRCVGAVAQAGPPDGVEEPGAPAVVQGVLRAAAVEPDALVVEQAGLRALAAGPAVLAAELEVLAAELDVLAVV